MPRKNCEASHFEKLFFLFELFFLREWQEWSVPELERRFRARGIPCARNTVRNLIEDLRKALGYEAIKIRREGKKILFSARFRFVKRKPGDISELSLMDYTTRAAELERLTRALRERLLCRVIYRSLRGEPREHVFLPLRAVSRHDVIYIYGWRYPDEKTVRAKRELIKDGSSAPGYPFLLTFHRIKTLEFFMVGGRPFGVDHLAPEQRQFLELLNERHYGLIKKEPFRVHLRFDEEVATYIKERTWSPDQEFPTENEIVFSATSRPEVKSLVLSFGRHVELLAPRDLREEIAREIRELGRIYESHSFPQSLLTRERGARLHLRSAGSS